MISKVVDMVDYIVKENNILWQHFYLFTSKFSRKPTALAVG
jgi:hypothetical protein